MQLIYRGHIFQSSLRPTQSYRKPIALNWRYQVPGERYGDEAPVPPVYQPPRAINWRWRVQD
jgi:hypothetical protein